MSDQVGGGFANHELTFRMPTAAARDGPGRDRAGQPRMTMDSTVVMVTASSTRPSCPWRSRIVRFAVTQRTPAMYGFREFVSDDGLPLLRTPPRGDVPAGPPLCE